MCGISGIINYDRKKVVDSNDLERITDVIAHRGPDGFGYWSKDNIGLGHRRLSIIDLSGSKQPMSVEEDRYTITYNGEIYNFLELKNELFQLGHSFKSTGDTEVILKAYIEWGKDCLQKFRGMFAFAIVDTVKREVFIARDHFGIKPLVYYTGKHSFVFGSEIQQFKELNYFSREINVNALSEYFKYGYIPAPLTIYNNLHKLEPGFYLKLNLEGQILEHEQYYDVDFNIDNSVSYEEWTERVEKALDTSVNYHKIADVPYGSFLSGGIDSSLIASSLTDEQKSVDVFTMGFSNKNIDEVPYAKQVAEKYNLNHHIEYCDMSNMEDSLLKLIEHYGEPYADSSCIPTYFISKKIREYLPVVLSGDGGDEAFGGYYSYQNFLKIKNPHAPNQDYKNIIKRGLKLFGKTFKTNPRDPDLNDWISLVGYFNQEEISTFFNEDVIKNIDLENHVYKKWYDIGKERNLDDYTIGSYLDYKTYMHGDILTKVDIASMMNSLEVRTPFIDVEIVSLMAKIPAKYKITRNRDGSWDKKKILNSISEKRFGRQFIERKKQGFYIPLQDWLSEKTKLGNSFHKIIQNENSYIYKYLNSERIQDLFSDSSKLNYNKMYQILVLEKWLKMENE